MRSNDMLIAAMRNNKDDQNKEDYNKYNYNKDYHEFYNQLLSHQLKKIWIYV